MTPKGHAIPSKTQLLSYGTPAFRKSFVKKTACRQAIFNGRIPRQQMTAILPTEPLLPGGPQETSDNF